MEKVYHIYAKKECLYNNLSKEEFNNTWETLKGMVGLMKTDYELEDLSYEECTLSPHWKLFGYYDRTIRRRFILTVYI